MGEYPHTQRFRDRCLKSKHKSIRLKKEKKQMTRLNFVTEAYPKERKIALPFAALFIIILKWYVL